MFLLIRRPQPVMRQYDRNAFHTFFSFSYSYTCHMSNRCGRGEGGVQVGAFISAFFCPTEKWYKLSHPPFSSTLCSSITNHPFLSSGKRRALSARRILEYRTITAILNSVKGTRGGRSSISDLSEGMPSMFQLDAMLW